MIFYLTKIILVIFLWKIAFRFNNKVRSPDFISPRGFVLCSRINPVKEKTTGLLTAVIGRFIIPGNYKQEQDWVTQWWQISWGNLRRWVAESADIIKEKSVQIEGVSKDVGFWNNDNWCCELWKMDNCENCSEF